MEELLRCRGVVESLLPAVWRTEESPSAAWGTNAERHRKGGRAAVDGEARWRRTGIRAARGCRRIGAVEQGRVERWGSSLASRITCAHGGRLLMMGSSAMVRGLGEGGCFTAILSLRTNNIAKERASFLPCRVSGTTTPSAPECC